MFIAAIYSESIRAMPSYENPRTAVLLYTTTVGIHYYTLLYTIIHLLRTTVHYCALLYTTTANYCTYGVWPCSRWLLLALLQLRHATTFVYLAILYCFAVLVYAGDKSQSTVTLDYSVYTYYDPGSHASICIQHTRYTSTPFANIELYTKNQEHP